MNKATQKRRRIRDKADVAWKWRCMETHGQFCEYCGKPAVQVHHFHRKSQHGHLRFVVANGIMICQGCHLIVSETPIGIDIIRKNRGEEWYQDIMEQAKNKPAGFKSNEKFYKEALKVLTKS